MRMLSGRLHGLMVGLALLVSAPAINNTSYGQMHGGLPGGMMNPDAPMSMSFPGPAPGEVVYAGANSYGPSCDTGYCGCGGMGCEGCGGGSCGVGSGPLARLLRGGGDCPTCGGFGCGACGGTGCGGAGTLLSGRLASLLGPLAPYSEGGRETPRWFDFYAGTMGLRRTTTLGGFQTGNRSTTTGEFFRSTDVSSNGISGPIVLRTNDLDIDKIRYGLEVIAALQTGPGSNLEARYFGLNNWKATASQNFSGGAPTLFSVFSLFGTSPTGGFDDTDRSFIHTLSYESELHNGEVNYRRRYQTAADWMQGSWLAGVRYFDLDERMGFSAVGSNNNTFTFDQLRFSNIDVNTRNQLTGFQIGGDVWLNVMPGVKVGVEGKGGIYGNHHEVAHSIVANSVPQSGEFLQDGRTAYLTEFSASVLYRLSYSWTAKASYNLLYVDNVALAPENLNSRGLANLLNSGAFQTDRFPTIDADSEVLFQGFSFGAEYTY